MPKLPNGLAEGVGLELVCSVSSSIQWELQHPVRVMQLNDDGKCCCCLTNYPQSTFQIARLGMAAQYPIPPALGG
jgi:hypothetical protein